MSKQVSAPAYHPAAAQDFLPTDQLRQLQLRRLQKVVAHTYHNQESGLLKQRMDEKGVKPEDIKSLEDIAKLPFMTKADLRDYYPYGLNCVPIRDVVRFQASSGTTGKPIVCSYTQKDLNTWADGVRRCMIMGGVTKNDLVQVSYGYGLFTGGLGAHDGASLLGATVLPTSSGNTERQVMLMQDLGINFICCTPSYFTNIMEKAREMGVDIRTQTKLRGGFFGAEPWSDSMVQHIQEETGIVANNIYGLTEVSGPGVAGSCFTQNGLHIFEDYFYPEIINPETGEVLPDGEEGELVFTTLTKEATPMIRYRTRDITRFITEPCACGRTVRRMERIGRRSDDMLIIRGVNLFPSQIETALLRVKGISPYYQIIVTREGLLDNIEVQVEVLPGALGDTMSSAQNLQAEVQKAILGITGLKMKITLADSKTVARSEGKAKRVIDKRKNIGF